MKRNTKKGFTLVELVIVIAVIAILAGVLIPTFSSVVTKANESKEKQLAVNEFKEKYALALADGVINSSDTSYGFSSDGNTWTSSNGYTYTLTANGWVGPTK